MLLLKLIGKDLYQRLVVAWKSTLAGVALGIVVETVNTVLLPYMNAQPQAWLHAVAGIIALVLVSLKAKVAAPALAAVPNDPPKGFADLRLLVALAVVAAGCATLKGASTSTTVTLQNGQSYSLSVSDTGGCVATGAGVWVKVPKTPLECDSVCLDVAPGALTPGAKCRVCDYSLAPPLCVPVEFSFPVPTKTGA